MTIKRFPPMLLLLALVCSLGLAACGGTKITKENFDKIKTGMTQAEVQAILGEPTEASSVDVAMFSGTTSKWQHGDSVISIQFVNGKVVAKQFSKNPER